MLKLLKSKKHPGAIFLCDKYNSKEKQPHPKDVFIAKVYNVVDRDIIAEAFVMAWKKLKQNGTVDEEQSLDDMPDPMDDSGEPHINEQCPECCKPEYACTCGD
jgi:hypothetical protein